MKNIKSNLNLEEPEHSLQSDSYASPSASLKTISKPLGSADLRSTDVMMANQCDGQYVIDPRGYRIDRGYVIFMIAFWLVWAPVTVYSTFLALSSHQPFLYVWLIGGYLGTILIPLSLFRKNRRQILRVVGELLVICGAGLLPTSRVQIQRKNLRALTLERHGSLNRRETVYTLNLLQKEGIRPRRTMLAVFVHPRDKTIILEEISSFFRNHGFVFEVRNELEES